MLCSENTAQFEKNKGFTGALSILEQTAQRSIKFEQWLQIPELCSCCPVNVALGVNSLLLFVVSVENAACRPCPDVAYAKLSLPEAYLASITSVDDRNGCGTAQCPWLIEVQPGQKIKVTMYVFSVEQHTSSCLRYGTIKEDAAGSDKKICSGREKVVEVYESVSNAIEIHVISAPAIENRGHFLLHYKGNHNTQTHLT